MQACLKAPPLAIKPLNTPRFCYPTRSRKFVLHATSPNQPDPSKSALKLPGGGYWWTQIAKNDTIVYGDTFVLERPGRSGQNLQGLIPASKNVHVERWSKERDASANKLPAICQPTVTGGLTLSGIIVIDTEYEILGEDGTTEFLPSSCTGIVHVGTVESNSTADILGMEASSGLHPRRTRRVRFTCNLCGEDNLKEVNPHAWRHGSVFARCGGCNCVHKLVDNLKIFHELQGPIFPPRDMRKSFPAVQEIIERIEEKRRNQRLDN